MTIDDLPAPAASGSRRLCEAMLAILGDDLVAAWLHGGTTFVDRPAGMGDLDICAVIGSASPDERVPRHWRADPGSRPARLEAAREAIASEVGVAFDTTYLLASEIGTGRLPPRAFQRSSKETGWAIYRAHWLAGQYVPLHGRRPEELVIPPTAVELRRALDRELEHLERHVIEGDAADPYEATYGILNGCRILHTISTGSPVLSKRAAGIWGLEHLPDRWRGAIAAALRSYDQEASAADVGALRDSMGSFVAMVRAELPTTTPRRTGGPRWS